MKKRLICLLMALVMMFTLLPYSVFAEDSQTDVPDETEIQADDLNILDGSGTPDVPLNTGESSETEIPPEKKTAVVTIVLKNKAGDPLCGAAFELTNGSDLLTWTTDSSGSCTLENLNDGEYVLKQSSAPAGYLLGDAVKWQLAVKDEGTVIEVSAYQSDGTLGTVQQATVDNGLVLNVTNEKCRGSLEISKTVAFEKEDQTGLESADWTESDDDAVYTVTVNLTDEKGNFVSGTFGTTEFKNGAAVLTMKAGETVALTEIPWGYGYTVSENTTDAEFVSTISPAKGTINADSTAVTALSTYRYESHNAGFSGVWVDAKDSKKTLVGVLGLYSDKDCKTEIAKVKTEEQGKFFFEISAAGTYYLKELETPKGYHPNQKVITVTAAEQTVVVKGVTQKRMIFTAEGLKSTSAEEGVDKAYSDKVFSYESAPIQAVTVKVTVSWDVPDGYKKLPESVSVQLYRDGAVYGEAVTLNKENSWSHSWSGSGFTDEYTWTVKQVETPENYKEKNNHQGGNTYKIVNTLQYKKITVSASVSWLSPKNYDKQPTSAKVVLYRDGKAFQTVTLSEANNWTCRWSNLPDCFEWTVDEPKVPEGYKKKITHVGNAWVVVNAHEQIPLTGDDSNVWLWAVATGVAAVGLAASVFLLLKKRKQDDEE